MQGAASKRFLAFTHIGCRAAGSGGRAAHARTGLSGSASTSVLEGRSAHVRLTIPWLAGELPWQGKFGTAGSISSALIGLLLVSCGSDSGNPASPTGPSGGFQAPASILRIDVSAPESIAPGESAPLTATAVKSDGSTENVTTSAVWSSSSTRVIQIGGDGRATAVSVGEATVQARFQSRAGGRLVLVLPSGDPQSVRPDYRRRAALAGCFAEGDSRHWRRAVGDERFQRALRLLRRCWRGADSGQQSGIPRHLQGSERWLDRDG